MNKGCIKLRKQSIIIGIVLAVFVICYFVYALGLDFTTIDSGYRITVFMPLLFVVCYLLFLQKPLLDFKSPFIVIFILVCIMRYVVLSILTLNAGSFSFLSSNIDPTNESIRLAGYLMCYELVVCCIAIRFLSYKIIGKKFINHNDIELENNSGFVYILFIVFSIVMLILVPDASTGLSIGFDVQSADNDSVGSFLALGIRECFVNAKYFLLFIVLGLLNKYCKKNMILSYIIAMLVCVLVIGIRIGSNKKKLICDALTCMVILYLIYPRQRRVTVGALGSLAAILVFYTAIFRGQADGNIVNFFTQYFDLYEAEQYFGGQYHLAIAIEAKEIYSDLINWKTYILHYLRPMFIIGSFVKQIPGFTMLSDIFDKRMSMGMTGHRGDQILVTLGDGYMLYGKIFAPVLSVLTTALGLLFDRIFKKSNKLEVIFISVGMAFYCALFMTFGSTQVINTLSYRLTIYCSVYWINNKIKISK